LAYGGGVKSESSAKKVVECGVDKVIVNSAFASDSTLLSRIAESVGASSTMASIDCTNKDGDYQVRNHQGKVLEEVVHELEQQGAGELLVQSVDLDGSRLGPDIALAKRVLDASTIPLVYAGGVASLDDAARLWKLGVDGVAAGSWFVFREPHNAVLVTYPSRKKIIEALGRA
jgi:cyclase